MSAAGSTLQPARSRLGHQGTTRSKANAVRDLPYWFDTIRRAVGFRRNSRLCLACGELRFNGRPAVAIVPTAKIAFLITLIV